MKKKSIVGWTHSGWVNDFGRSLDNIIIPDMFLWKQSFKIYNRTDDNSLIKKVRVTIEEI